MSENSDQLRRHPRACIRLKLLILNENAFCKYIPQIIAGCSEIEYILFSVIFYVVYEYNINKETKTKCIFV